jgi:hypothetical protein
MPYLYCYTSLNNRYIIHTSRFLLLLHCGDLLAQSIDVSSGGATVFGEQCTRAIPGKRAGTMLNLQKKYDKAKFYNKILFFVPVSCFAIYRSLARTSAGGAEAQICLICVVYMHRVGVPF